jgi:hypothetical protein
VLGELLILLLVPFELLFSLLSDTAVDILLLSQPFKYPLDDTKFLVIPDVLAVHGVQITLTKGEIVNGIEQIGLPHPVLPHEAIDLLTERKIELFIILEVDE